MKIPPPWKNALLLLLVFVAGGVAGGLVTHHRMTRAFSDAFDFDRWPDRGTEMLASRLKLTTEQRPKIHAIQADVAAQMKAHFQRALTEVGRIVVEAGRMVDQELTPEQRVIHDEMKREMRAVFKEHFDITLPEV